MWNQFDPARIFAAELILAVLLFYFVYLQLRRLKYRRIAGGLQAEYESQGLFKSGEIIGSSKGRKYSIRTRTFGRSIWTTFTMDCANKGILLRLGGHFFKDFPNWKFAYTRSDRSERVFVTNVTISNGDVPLQEKYHTQVQCIFQEVALVDSEWLRKWRNRVEIKQDAVSYTTHGVLKNIAVAKQILSFLAKVAERIEAEPVSQ